MSQAPERRLDGDHIEVNPENSFLTDFNPKDHVLGVIDVATDLDQFFRELEESGFTNADVQIWIGEEGARQIDPWGTEHGPIATLKRMLQTHVDFDFEHYYADEARVGHYVAAVHVRRNNREAAQDLMKRHGARNLYYFGGMSFEEII